MIVTDTLYEYQKWTENWNGGWGVSLPAVSVQFFEKFFLTW